MQLAVLFGYSASCNDTQFPSSEVECGSAQHLTISFYDHPRIEFGVKHPDIMSELAVGIPVNGGAGGFAELGESGDVIETVGRRGLRG